MNREQMLLLKLAEECVEVAHRVHKAVKFGLSERQPGQDLDNSERIMEELLDLFAVLQLLEREGYLKDTTGDNLGEVLESRTERIEKYMQYSKNLGIIKD